MKRLKKKQLGPMVKRLLTTTGLALALLISLPAGATEWTARDYALFHCGGGVAFVDFTVDCLTDSHALAVGPAREWAELIRRASNYSVLTGEKAGILVVVDPEVKGTRYLAGLFSAIGEMTCPHTAKPCIDVWVITKGF